MTKPTDDEIGTLLRETFADKENLVEHLPEATKHRRTPVLLAAAAVLLILGGILYAAGRGDPSPPPVAQATETVPTAQTQSADPLIWATGIEGILEREPGTKPIVLYVLDAPHQGAGDPTGGRVRGTPFTDAERVGIENALAGVARIEWIRTAGNENCDVPKSRTPIITLAPIVHKDGHVELGISSWYDCLAAHWLTFRLDQKAGSWQITGTVGPEAIS